MGISVLSGTVESGAYGIAIMYCNTQDQAFGPVFQEGTTLSAEEIARAFIRWHDVVYGDPRTADLDALETRYIKYRKAINQEEE